MGDLDEETLVTTTTSSSSSSSSSSFSSRYNCLYQLIPILLESLNIIFLQNPKLFFAIYVTTALPLSLLLASLSGSSRAVKSHVAHLEWLANVVPIWIEADNVRDEARADALALLRVKAIYDVPILVFSLLALIAAVSSTMSGRRNLRPTVGAALMAVRVTWVRPMLTCMVSYVVRMGWGLVVDVLASAVGYPAAVAAVVAGAAIEVHLMAVLSLAMVVSVAEERAGVNAVRAGSDLMRGRRVCGWVLSGLILLGTGCVGREMEGGDLVGVYDRTVGMRVVYMSGLVGFLGWVVLWSYVVFTLLYFDCRKMHVNA